MRKSTFFVLLIVLCLSTSTLTAGTVTVTTTASFTGGLLGNWSFDYVSGAPDLYLESIQIDLPANVYFNTVQGGGSVFGSLSYEDVTISGSSDGVYNILPGTGLALNGLQEVTFYFNDFLPGDTFNFGLDVDHANPTLATCSGGPIVVALCNSANAAKLLAAQTVLSGQMAGATATYVFGGPGYYTGSGTGTFQAPTLADILRGNSGSTLDISTDIQNPEPGTIVMLGVGLAALGVLRRRRR